MRRASVGGEPSERVEGAEGGGERSGDDNNGLCSAGGAAPLRAQTWKWHGKSGQGAAVALRGLTVGGGGDKEPRVGVRQWGGGGVRSTTHTHTHTMEKGAPRFAKRGTAPSGQHRAFSQPGVLGTRCLPTRVARPQCGSAGLCFADRVPHVGVRLGFPQRIGRTRRVTGQCVRVAERHGANAGGRVQLAEQSAARRK